MRDFNFVDSLGIAVQTREFFRKRYFRKHYALRRSKSPVHIFARVHYVYCRARSLPEIA